ncbi:MAG: DUF92 domain-containing protein [Armatimonadota bacterium]|nr:DUF92 domain-containing protein [Armatimonadota bacterium]
MESRDVSLPVVALALGIVATLAAYALRLFTAGGAAAALAVGAVVLLAGGWGLTVTLVGTFVGAGLLTWYRRGEKLQPEHRRGRSAAQVLANGTVPAVAALAGAILDSPRALPAAVGAMAATAADTWATELGLLSRRMPRLITTGAVVPRGRSGGITPLGTASGVGGALVAAILGRLVISASTLGIAPIVTGGVAGFLVDSLLGATLQARYRCPACGQEGEAQACTCGAQRRLAGGWRWVINDVVNIAATAVGAVVAAFLSR